MKRKDFVLQGILPGVCVLLADQLIKLFIQQYPAGATALSIPGLLEITYCVNTGAAFSVFSGYSGLIAAVSAVLLVFVVVFFLKEVRITPLRICVLSILCGGGLGNWIDRMLYGGVIDYIRLRFIHFPVFNLADICITVSVAVLAVSLIAEEQKSNQEQVHGTDD